jgi:maltose alpha-D-glucosyltransferase/alpha-amylase
VGPIEAAENDHESPLVGPHREWAQLLGRRTAEMHQALSSATDAPDFAPEPFTAIDRQAMFHGARSLVKRNFRAVRRISRRSSLADAVLEREDELVARLRRLVGERVDVARIRCHGDYHLGQVLWTGKDFVIIDFEGEPARSLSHRRLKRPAFVDVAGMVRSFHYASLAASAQLRLDLAPSSEPDALGPLQERWYRHVARLFVDAYLETAGDARFVPDDRGHVASLLEFLMLEKAVYELGYEANSRPDWIDIPAAGLLDLLEHGV